MAVKVTITVEIESGSPANGKPRTQVLTATENMTTQAVQRWAAPAVEETIANMGADLVRQVAALHGDMRDTHPDAPGLRGRQGERPLTGRDARAGA